jgi:hypothetical protein
MYDKIFFDSGDDGFSQIITGLDKDGKSIAVVNDDDIYPINQNHVSGFGSITLDKTRRTASLFSQYDTISPQNFSNNVKDISVKYLLDSKEARLPIPLTTGLHALSPFHINVTANKGEDTVNNIFDNTWYDFSVPYDYLVNMDNDNILNVKRDDANPRVLLYQYDPNFGQIKSLKINDVEFSGKDLPECLKITSSDTCVISVPQEYLTSELIISGKNIWNGTAKNTIAAINDASMLNPPQIKVESLIFERIFAQRIVVFLGLSLILLIGFVVYRKSRQNS